MGAKSIHHTTHIPEDNQYNGDMVDPWVNDLIKGTLNVSVDSICNDILETELRCQNHNIDRVYFKCCFIK